MTLTEFRFMMGLPVIGKAADDARRNLTRLRPLSMTRSIMRHWLAIFLIVYGLLDTLRLVARVFMKLEWANAENAICADYSFFCHQMAQRSFFVFGKHAMRGPAQLPVRL